MTRPLRIEIFSRPAIGGIGLRTCPQWYFHIRAGNGRIIVQSEGYHSRASCLKTARLLFYTMFSATISVEGKK